MKVAEFLAFDAEEFPYKVMYAFDEYSRGCVSFMSFMKAREYFDHLRSDLGARSGLLYVNAGTDSSIQDSFGLEGFAS